MFKLFKNFSKKDIFYIILCILFIVVQVWLDLKLPDYTSKIVNTGIQAGGIETAVPEIISKDDFECVQRILNYSPLMLKSDDIVLRYLKCPDCGSKFYKKKN